MSTSPPSSRRRIRARGRIAPPQRPTHATGEARGWFRPLLLGGLVLGVGILGFKNRHELAVATKGFRARASSYIDSAKQAWAERRAGTPPEASPTTPPTQVAAIPSTPPAPPPTKVATVIPPRPPTKVATAAPTDTPATPTPAPTEEESRLSHLWHQAQDGLAAGFEAGKDAFVHGKDALVHGVERLRGHPDSPTGEAPPPTAVAVTPNHPLGEGPTPPRRPRPNPFASQLAGAEGQRLKGPQGARYDLHPYTRYRIGTDGLVLLSGGAMVSLPRGGNVGLAGGAIVQGKAKSLFEVVFHDGGGTLDVIGEGVQFRSPGGPGQDIEPLQRMSLDEHFTDPIPVAEAATFVRRMAWFAAPVKQDAAGLAVDLSQRALDLAFATARELPAREALAASERWRDRIVRRARQEADVLPGMG